MNLIVLDITLLVLFVVTASVFLYLKRRNLQKEGALFLYKTSWGIKLIDSIGSRYKKTLKFLSYASISLGYFLMGGIIYLMVNSVYLYFTSGIADTIKAPPVAPLIPYFPKLFGLESFFPPFYFVYFIVAILIVATVHEFSHGIFARRYGIKINSTGFAFFKYFPAFFGAFVEQDDKQMNKAKKTEQMSVLSAGVFANVVVGVLFYAILFGFFLATFSVAGVQFNTYAYSVVEVSAISFVNKVSVNSYDEVLANADEELNEIFADGKTYLASTEMLSEQTENSGQIILYDESPAAEAQIGSVIAEINSVKITSMEKLQDELKKYSPNEEVEITTISDGESKVQKIALGENPDDKELAWLGVGFYENSGTGFSGLVSKIFPSYKKPHIYYEPANDLSLFIKDLLWWIVIINLLVAFFNMLPLGILDGGRFFYLTILGITGSEKIAKRTFKGITIAIIFLFGLLMVRWVFGIVS